MGYEIVGWSSPESWKQRGRRSESPELWEPVNSTAGEEWVGEGNLVTRAASFQFPSYVPCL